MSHRINSYRLITSIGIRFSGHQIPSICFGNWKCIRFELAWRSVSRRSQTKRSYIQLDNNFWGLATITRTVRKYLGAGKDYVSILKSNPLQSSSLLP